MDLLLKGSILLNTSLGVEEMNLVGHSELGAGVAYNREKKTKVKNIYLPVAHF